MILFDSETIRVRTGKPTRMDSLVVVCFQPYHPRPDFENPAFAEDLLNAAGVTGLYVLTSANHWYQTPDFDLALQAIHKACAHATRVVTYGSSMGAYAALIASRRLDADAVVALNPQFSIDPRKVPFENRWLAEATKLDHKWDDMAAGVNPDSEIYLVLDPTGPDAQHSRLIQSASRLSGLLIAPFAGHPVTSFLVEAGIVSDVTMRMLRGEATVPQLRKLIRSSRAKSPIYWATMGLARADRHPEQAMECLRRAEALSPTRPETLREIDVLRHRLDDLGAANGVLEPAAGEHLDHGAPRDGVTVHHLGGMRPADRRLLGRGWSTPEGDGTWMVGDVSELLLPPALFARGPIEIAIRARPLIYGGKSSSQQLVVTADNQLLYRDSLRRAAVVRFTVAGSAAATEPVRISLLHPDAISPSELGFNEDQRRLSFFVSEVEVGSTSRSGEVNEAFGDVGREGNSPMLVERDAQDDDGCQ